jgi:hypothetical protein
MPNEKCYQWATARMINNELVFEARDGLERALHDGFFFVQAPATLKLFSGDMFATHFYLPKSSGSHDRYCGYRSWTADRLAEHEGYFLRKADQVEQFFLERRFWNQVFPLELSAQAEQMRLFGLEILKSVLSSLPIPSHLWNEATGNCLSDQGTYHLTFNHFRPFVRARGLNVHKDSGWVTILRSLKPGLEVLRKKRWLPITPRPDAFIVNFGCAMEILTRDTEMPVAAVAHRVVEQQPDNSADADRFSYALFIDSSLDNKLCKGLYRYSVDQGLVLETSFKDFLDKILHNTYEENTKGLY